MRLKETILAHVRNPAYRPVKPKALVKALGLPSDHAAALKKAIKKLIRAGELTYGANHLIGLPEAVEPGGVTGVFRRMSGGYGFVRPRRTSLAEPPVADIYIAAKNAGDASTGDIVLVRRLSEKGGGGPKRGPAGIILRVVERDTHRFVGLYFERGGTGLVDVDGKPFSHPILVGDPGAKGARPNDKVLLEMVRFPSHVHEGEGVVLEVLGRRGDPGVDTASIIHEFGLPGDFNDATLETARRAAEAFDETIGHRRADRTSVPVVTIDPQDARDFDDAISLEAAGNGHWRLGVHIADVSHFVRPRTPLEREARDRATSVYLPDRVIPMLPEIISNNLASLQPDRVRYALTAWIEFTRDGTRTDVQLEKTAIRSRRRFTYDEVDNYLADPQAWKTRLSPEVHALLGHMHQLAMTLRKRRFERGSLELSMPEVRVDLDRDGRVTGAHVVENTESHQIIEAFMLAANEAVADLLRDRGILFLRRVHASPDPRKQQALTEFVTEIGFETESLESRFAVQRLLETVRGLPQQHAVNFAVLRSMQKAIYSPAEEGHYALASDCYCHFTSPIRRYPDLTVHRLITAVLADQPPMSDETELLALGEHCSEREQRAEKAERELTKVKLLEYLSQRIGDEMDGIITGVEEFGLFIQGTELPAEGFVHISAISDDYYRLDRTSHTLTGHREGNQFRLGDAVRVAVAHVDVGRRELDFRLISRLGHAIEKVASARPGAKTARNAPRPGRPQTRRVRRKRGTGKTAARKKTKGRRKES